MGGGLTSGAGGVGEEGGLRFSFVDQKEQRAKAAHERVCGRAHRNELPGSLAPFYVSFMAWKKVLLFPLLSHTCTSAYPPAP